MANLKTNYAIWIVFSFFISTLINLSATKNIDRGDEMCLKNEKLAEILFYFEDVSGGPNMIVHEVARANISTDALTSFGKVYVVEVAITAAPAGVDSEVLGKAQGILTYADKEMSAAQMDFNVAFTAGKYNGSTISFAGHNRVVERQRPVPVVGGTGVFRFTRGYAVITFKSSRIGEDSFVYSVLEYSVFTTFCP